MFGRSGWHFLELRVEKLKKIFVAGHKGMVGSAICKQLAREDEIELLTCDRTELDLRELQNVEAFLRESAPDMLIIAAARVGGIMANNTYPADFIFDNLQIQNALIHSAHTVGIERLLFLGSSCIYPKFAQQPIREEALMSGALEPTNEAYAVAKIAGIMMCQSYRRQYGRDYRCIMPTNLYGPNDNYHGSNSHVVPALLKRFHEAKLAGEDTVSVWGDGTPMRELMYVDDLASIAIEILKMTKNRYECVIGPGVHHLNVGSGTEVTIKELANIVKDVVGFSGSLLFDKEKPNGTPRKALDCRRLRSIIDPKETSLRAGLTATYKAYVDSLDVMSGRSRG